MVKVYPDEIPEIWNTLVKNNMSYVNYLSQQNFSAINERLAPYSGFLSYDMVNYRHVYYLEFVSERHKTLFLMKNG